MPLDRSKLNKGFQIYLANAEKASGKTYEDMALILSQSGLKKHGELRTRLMDKLGLGHGHANAVAAIWLMPGNSEKPVAAKKEPAKGPVAKIAPAKSAAPPAKKAISATAAPKLAVKSATRKTATKKPAAKKK